MSHTNTESESTKSISPSDRFAGTILDMNLHGGIFTQAEVRFLATCFDLEPDRAVQHLSNVLTYPLELQPAERELVLRQAAAIMTPEDFQSAYPHDDYALHRRRPRKPQNSPNKYTGESVEESIATTLQRLENARRQKAITDTVDTTSSAPLAGASKITPHIDQRRENGRPIPPKDLYTALVEAYTDPPPIRSNAADLEGLVALLQDTPPKPAPRLNPLPSLPAPKRLGGRDFTSSDEAALRRLFSDKIIDL